MSADDIRAKDVPAFPSVGKTCGHDSLVVIYQSTDGMDQQQKCSVCGKTYCFTKRPKGK